MSQGGIKINDSKIDDLADIKLENEMIIQIGKKVCVKFLWAKIKEDIPYNTRTSSKVYKSLVQYN